MALALDTTGIVYAIDWGRRRLLSWTTVGKLRGDIALVHGPLSHLAVGPIAIHRDAEIVDYMLGGHVSGIALSRIDLDSIPLLYLIDSSGAITHTFGYLDMPQDAEALALRSLLQIGGLSISGDSIFVLRYQQPRLEVYTRAHGRAPVRIMALRRWRREAVPTERRGTVHERGFLTGSRVQLNDAATGFGRDAAGRLYVVMLGDLEGDVRERMDSPWLTEALWVFDAEGLLLRRFLLPTRNTRGLAVASDGSVLMLSHPTAAPDASWDIVRIPPLDRQAGDGGQCRWAE